MKKNQNNFVLGQVRLSLRLVEVREGAFFYFLPHVWVLGSLTGDARCLFGRVLLRAYLKVRGASVLLLGYLDPFQKHIRVGKVVQDFADECRLVKGTP